MMVDFYNNSGAMQFDARGRLCFVFICHNGDANKIGLLGKKSFVYRRGSPWGIYPY